MKKNGDQTKKFFAKLKRICSWPTITKIKSENPLEDNGQFRLKAIDQLTSDKSIISGRLVINGFMLAFLCTVVILAGLVWYTWRSNQHLKMLETTHFRLLQLSGQIIYIDEVLTMSAHMAVETGELEWEERYRNFEPQLDSAIKEVIELSPEQFMKEAISQTDTANIELVAMENSAFDLIRQGQRETALKLLHSTKYTKQKQVYSSGINEISNAICTREQAGFKNELQIALITIIFLIVTMPLVGFIWFLALRILRRYIHERRRTELALRVSEQCFSAIADYSYFWEIWVNSDGRPVWTNPAVQRLTGYSIKEFMAMPDYPMPLVCEEDRPSVARACRSALEGGSGKEFQFHLKCKDGTVIWAEMSWQPIFDDKGQSQGHRISIRDIMDRKQAEEALLESEQRFRDFFENAPIGFHIFDPDQIVIDINDAELEMIGYSRNEIVGKKMWAELIVPQQQDMFKKHWHNIITKRHVRNLEYTLIHKDGHHIDVILNASARFDKDDNLVNTCGSVLNITARKKADNQLRQSEGRYRALVENVGLGINLIDADHNIIMANSTTAKLFGCDVSELIGKKCYHTFEKKQAVCFYCPGEKAMKTGQAEEIETEGVRDDGSHFSVRVQAFPLFAEEGEPTGFIEVVEDITEQRRIDRALRMIVEASSAAIGPQFFQSLVKSLSFALGFKYALIGELTSKQPRSVYTLAVWANDDFSDNFEYNLAGTPCENVITKKVCFHTSNARERFPRDVLLKELGVESYFGVPLFDAFDQPLGLLVVMHNEPVEDISKIESILKIFAARASAELERIRAEQKVASIARFPDENPNMVLRISDDGAILYNNKAASALLDISQCQDADLMLKHLHKYVPKVLELSELLQTEITCCGKIYSLTFAPIADSGYVNVYGLEITARKQAERTLKKSRERLSLAFSAANDGLWDWNIKTGEVYFSPRYYTMLGYKPNEFPATYEAWINLLHPDEKQATEEKIREHIERKSEGFEEEFRLKTKTGDWQWILSKGKVVQRGANDEPVRMVGTHSDITERKQAQWARQRLNKELETKNKELESILYAASHDLKSPLVNIQGFGYELSQSCDLIRSVLMSKGKAIDMEKAVDSTLNEDIPNALGFIMASTTKMDSLLSGLLDVCRLNTATTDVKHIDMNAMMSNITESMEYQIKESAAKIDIETLPPCIGDPLQMNRAFSNLLTNALKFLDKSRSGRIHIYGKSQNGKSIYCVEDNGIGIAPEQQEKIFQIFYQHEPDKRKGEGIGLTIVKRIIDRHNGKIWVESESGKGSKFFVSLPNV